MDASLAPPNTGSCRCTWLPARLRTVEVDDYRYLPLGTGLFQAQNQQLLLVSRKQNRMLRTEEFKPMYRGHNKSTGTGTGTPRYWFWRVKLWWQGVSTQGKYEGFVFVGMIVQVKIGVACFCESFVNTIPRSPYQYSFTASRVNSHRLVSCLITNPLDSAAADGSGELNLLTLSINHSLIIFKGPLRSFGSFFGTTSLVHICSGRFV